MSVSIPKSFPSLPAAPNIGDDPFPPLESGQHLTADEFMRRYEATPELENVELIEGVVQVASPVSQDFHGRHHANLMAWLVIYKARTPGTDAGADITTILGLSNVPQPDCVLFLLPGRGGQARVNETGYVAGAPELVVEVSASTVADDLNKKLPAYERSGIREYIICRVLDAQVDWFVLSDGKYSKLAPESDGTLRSETFPGLWLDPAALFRDDLATLFKTLDQGLDSPEHAEFVSQLRIS